ncbi:MAG: DUF2079 domain-containing protein [Chitinivibrionales bacterium]|nr:DUF2079 domain-containing protein [Chitinivibrionales bacterium]
MASSRSWQTASSVLLCGAYVFVQALGGKVPPALPLCALSWVSVVLALSLPAGAAALKAGNYIAVAASTWHIWLAAIWIRELFANRAFINALWLTGAIGSLSLSIGLRLRSTKAPAFVQHKHWPYIAALAYALVFGLQSQLRYLSYYNTWLDFGYMVHPIWNATQGRLLEMALLEGGFGSSLGDHFSLIFLLIVPLMKVIPFAATLYFVQSAAVATGGIIFYYTCKDILHSPIQALLMQASLYLWFPLQYGIISDFHADPLAVPFVFGMIWAFHKNRWSFWYACLIMAILCKEHIGLVIAPFIFIMAVQKRHMRIPLLATSVLSAVSTFVIQIHLIPLFNNGTETQAIANSFPGGEAGLTGVLATMLTRPELIAERVFTIHNYEQLTWLFAPLLLIPLASWKMYVATSVMMVKELYGTFHIYNHHQAILSPMLFWSILEILRRNDIAARKTLVIALVTSNALFGLANGESPLSHRFWRAGPERYFIPERARLLDEAVKMIPDRASVSSLGHTAIHLFKRRELYLYPHPFPRKMPEFVIFDMRYKEDGYQLVNKTFKNRPIEEMRNRFLRLRDSGKYETIFSRDGIYVLKKLRALSET